MSATNSTTPVPGRPTLAVRLLIVCLLSAGYLPVGSADRASAAGVDHLVVSEVMTGGASASDELIELYNPSSVSLPLEGLELVYVTASGATLTRRAAWSLGAPVVPPGAHVLVANELGVFAPIADALYASGMAATGGSVALRIQGATTAIDAVGWGTAASTWLEGMPAAAPPAGTSLERLPGGPAGSTSDTDSNAADFSVRSVPDPQNSGSPPVPDPTQPTPTPAPTDGPTPAPSPTATPSATPAPTATHTPTATPEPTPAPTPTATPEPTSIPIATARALADGTVVTVAGEALSPSDFSEGGGYLADASGGIAVLLDAGSFARGDQLLVRGVLDDRFAQRTIRASADGILVTGTGAGSDAVVSATGSVDESLEARLIRIQGTVNGSATVLSGGLAFDVDDGSGAVRVLVGTATGIDTAQWSDGVRVAVVGIVGQRDSSGTGSSGYRVQPRAADDVELLPAATPTPTPTPSGSETPSAQPTPTPSPSDGNVVSIADARSAAKNARVTVRGVVTLASGTVEAGSAVIQDESGAIVLRLGDEAGTVSRGQLVEVAGARSTKSGMETLRVTVAPSELGTASEPAARALRSGDAGEAAEAQLVIARGAVVASARTASSGTVSFEVDDGSGALRVVLAASLDADGDSFAAGTWVEVLGVLGQETTGAQPLRGFRVWPRDSAEVRILAAATGVSSVAGSDSASGATGGDGSAATVSLARIGEAGMADLRVGATLVASAWPELGVAGLLWDGASLVGIAPASGTRVEEVMEGRAVPQSLELSGLREQAQDPASGLSLVLLGDGLGDTMVGSGPPAPPATTMPGRQEPPAWVSFVGHVRDEAAGQVLDVDGVPVPIQRFCSREDRVPNGVVSLLGMATSSPSRIVVGCDGLRPAPVLALVATAAEVAEPTTSISPASVETDATATGGRRLLAAGLLSVGVGILVLAVVFGRRLGSDQPAADEPEEQEAEPTAPAGPQLTLVRLPNEHGP